MRSTCPPSPTLPRVAGEGAPSRPELKIRIWFPLSRYAGEGVRGRGL